MLAYIFANQGWGSLVGSVVTIVVLSIYKPVMNGEGHTSKVDGGKSYLLHPPRPRIVAD
jgi:MFS transporter, PHS family, inorganic phosphate transporter